MFRVLKNIGGFFLILFGLSILYISTTSTVLHKLFILRDNDKWYGDYQCNHGDLISMCYLDFVNIFRITPPNNVRKPEYSGTANTALYLYGDSYTWKLQDTLFAGVSEFHFIWRYFGGSYHLDKTKKNVLIIEISERMCRDYFDSCKIIDQFRDSTTHLTAFRPYPGKEYKKYASLIPPISLNDFFNKNINQNIQFNVFNYNLIIPMFEIKAALNYYLFNRASGDAVISNDRKYLFLRQTVSSTGTSSSYSSLPTNEIELMVDSINKIYDYYMNNGFNEVYLSIIPNSATIEQHQGYNNLIPLIQNSPRLKMKIIDVYTPFMNSNEDTYWHGDTHWNYTGEKIWLDIVNKMLVDKK